MSQKSAPDDGCAVSGGQPSMRSRSRDSLPADRKAELSKRGRNNKRRGANSENELARILSDHFGRVVKRTLGQARDGGHDIETPPFRWEVKRRKKLAVYDFIEQAAEACQDGATPVVAMRADGKGWLVLMRLEDALPLIRGELTPIGISVTQLSAEDMQKPTVSVDFCISPTETDYSPQEVQR